MKKTIGILQIVAGVLWIAVGVLTLVDGKDRA